MLSAETDCIPAIQNQTHKKENYQARKQESPNSNNKEIRSEDLKNSQPYKAIYTNCFENINFNWLCLVNAIIGI